MSAVRGLSERERASLADRGFEFVSEVVVGPVDEARFGAAVVRSEVRSADSPGTVALLTGEVGSSRFVRAVRPGSSSDRLRPTSDLGAAVAEWVTDRSPGPAATNADFSRVRAAASRVDLGALHDALEEYLAARRGSILLRVSSEVAVEGLLDAARGVEPRARHLDETVRNLGALAEGAPVEWVLRHLGVPS